MRTHRLAIAGIIVAVLAACLSFGTAQAVTPGTITTIAGGGVPGNLGPATSANLDFPAAVAVNGAGDLFIADTNHCMVRKVTMGTIIALAGTGVCGFGGDTGAPEFAQLDHPAGLALDSAGNLFISDTGNCRIRFVSGGAITTIAGSATCGSAGDGGLATSAQINEPRGLTVAADGTLYIADAGNCEVRKVTGGIISVVAGSTSCGNDGNGGPATIARFQTPTGVALDASGALLIADWANCSIRKVVAGTVTAFAGSGICDLSGQFGGVGDGGAAVAAQLGYTPSVVVRGPDVFIADLSNCRIRKVTAGIITTVPGTLDCSYGGAALPIGIAVNASDNLYVPFGALCVVRELVAGAYTTVAGNGSCAYGGDGGPGTDAAMGYVGGVALDSSSSLLIADHFTAGFGGPNVDCRVRKLAAGTIVTAAGTGACSHGTDGLPAPSVPIARPNDVAAAAGGTFYIATQCRVRMVSGGNITTLFTYGGSCPQGVAVDVTGNLYVADIDCRLREFSGGLWTVIAGTGTCGYNGDGISATSAMLGGMRGIAVDATGAVYIAEASPECRIRRISGGIITTVAGNGTCAFGGDNVVAATTSIASPYDVAVDSNFNLYLTGGCRVRKISMGTGIISTLAGTATCGFSGDGGPATAALIDMPDGVAVDNAGNVYFADSNNRRVRMIAAPAPPAVGGVALAPDLASLARNDSHRGGAVLGIAALATLALTLSSGVIVHRTRRRQTHIRTH